MDERLFLSERELNIIRGKVLVGHANRDEVLSVFAHLDAIENALDEGDDMDMFGTEGWRHWMGME